MYAPVTVEVSACRGNARTGECITATVSTTTLGSLGGVAEA